MQRPHDDASPSLAEPGSLRFATDRGPWQRSLRWDLRPRRDRRLLWFGGLIAFVVTLSEIVGFGLGMRNWHQRPDRPQVITVELIEPVGEPPPPPPDPEPPSVARASRVKVALPEVKPTPPPPLNTASDDDAMRARMGVGGAGVPQLFNPDGSVRLGGGTQLKLPDKPKTEREAAAARWAQIDAPINPLDCRKTRFAGAFAPDMSAGDKVASKYLKWIGLADPQAIRHRAEKRAESGGCEPAK